VVQCFGFLFAFLCEMQGDSPPVLWQRLTQNQALPFQRVSHLAAGGIGGPQSRGQSPDRSDTWPRVSQKEKGLDLSRRESKVLSMFAKNVMDCLADTIQGNGYARR